MLIRVMGMIKKAAALANQELDLVDVYHSGAGVSFHMNTNEVIANPPMTCFPRRCAWQ